MRLLHSIFKRTVCEKSGYWKAISRYASSQSTNTKVVENFEFRNPVEDFESLIEIPLLQDCLFQPTVEEVSSVQHIFKRNERKSHIIKLHKSIVNLDLLPETNIPEVAFIGRSNAGKSSMIRSIFHHTEKLKISISKKPGRTKALNFYQVGQCFNLVDMPGYGENMPKYYTESVEQYLQTRGRLRQCFLLIDSEIGMSDVDQTGFEMMEEFRKPYAIVLTKIDKITPHALLRKYLSIQRYRDKKLVSCFPQIFLLSSETQAGVGFLRAFIAYVTGNAQFKGL